MPTQQTETAAETALIYLEREMGWNRNQTHIEQKPQRDQNKNIIIIASNRRQKQSSQHPNRATLLIDPVEARVFVADPIPLDLTDRAKLDDRIISYLNSEKNWEPAEYRIEYIHIEQDGSTIAVSIIFLQDEQITTPSSGQSVELYLNQQSGTILRELAYQ